MRAESELEKLSNWQADEEDKRARQRREQRRVAALETARRGPHDAVGGDP